MAYGPFAGKVWAKPNIDVGGEKFHEGDCAFIILNHAEYKAARDRYESLKQLFLDTNGIVGLCLIASVVREASGESSIYADAMFQVWIRFIAVLAVIAVLAADSAQNPDSTKP